MLNSLCARSATHHTREQTSSFWFPAAFTSSASNASLTTLMTLSWEARSVSCSVPLALAARPFWLKLIYRKWGSVQMLSKNLTNSPLTLGSLAWKTLATVPSLNAPRLLPLIKRRTSDDATNALFSSAWPVKRSTTSSSNAQLSKWLKKRQSNWYHKSSKWCSLRSSPRQSNRSKSSFKTLQLSR